MSNDHTNGVTTMSRAEQLKAELAEARAAEKAKKEAERKAKREAKEAAAKAKKQEAIDWHLEKLAKLGADCHCEIKD